MIGSAANNEIIPGFDQETCEYLAIRLQRVDGSPISLLVDLTGSIDAYNCACVKRAVTQALESGFRRIILGLRGVDYVSSAGVGTLLTLLRIMMENGGDLMMLEPQPKVISILQLMHLDTFFGRAESVDAALRLPSLANAPAPSCTTTCPVCGATLRAPRTGHFRCPRCKSVLHAKENGQSEVAGVTSHGSRGPATPPQPRFPASTSGQSGG